MKGSFTIAILALICCGTSCHDEIESDVPQTIVVSSMDPNPPSTVITASDDLRKLVFDELEGRGRYRHPSAAEIERAVQLFLKTLSAETELGQIQSEWEAAGFDLESVENGGETFWVLKEFEDEKFGRGITVFRRSESVPVMLQAPHSFYDLGTEKIALELFLHSRSRVCFWNSIHRRVANLTEEEDSYLNALSVAFARSALRGRVIQIHGFSQTSDFKRFGRNVSLIISSGSETPSQSFLMLAQKVRQGCDPFETAVFPLDVDQLGGTQNRQRKVLLEEKLTDFVHCELSPAFRQIIQGDQELAERVGRELTRLELNPETD